MHEITKSFARLFFMMAAILCASCTEVVPVGAQEGSSNASELERKASLRSRVLNAWSNPELVGSANVISTANAYVHGPRLDINNAGLTYIGWRVHTDLNPVTGQYMGGATTVMRRDITAQWALDSPMPFNFQSQASLPELSVSSTDNQIVAAWVENRTVYANTNNGFGWQVASSIGSGDQVWVSNNDRGQVVVVWVQSLGNRFTIQSRRYRNGVWSNPASFSRDGVFVDSSQPVMDASGRILFVWQEEGANQRGIYSTSFESGNWSVPVSVRPAQPLGTELVVGLQLAMADQTGQAQLVIQVVDSISGDGLFAYAYQGSSWSSGRNIDGNINTNDRTQLEPFGFASNSRGEMVAAWVEEQTDNINYYSVIFASRFSPTIGWSIPQAVSPPVFRGGVNTPPTNIVPTYLSSIDAVIDDNGEASIAWIENSQGLSELFTAHYMNQSGWNVPELVVSYLGDQVLVEKPDLVLATNQPVLAWRQSRRTPQGVVYDFWSSRQLGAGGVPVSPVPVAPGAIKPPSHIPSSNNCTACHASNGVTVVDHREVIGLCYDCHNAVIASGKSPFHIPTSNRCDACHAANRWVPAIVVDHREVQGVCIACHNGTRAAGKGPFHIPSGDQCEQCHTTNNWSTTSTTPPVNSPITPTTPKPLNHIPSTNNCLSCHVGGSRFVQRVDHSQVIGSCSNCHNGVLASGKSIAHLPTTENCSACHLTTTWALVVTVDHTEVLGACFACHNGVFATGKSANHIVSSSQCDQCHSVNAWTPASNGNPINSGPSANWSAPAAVWTNTSPNSNNDYVHGPQLQAAPNNLFVSMVKHSQFNGLTGRYELGENFVYYSSAGIAWQQVLPAPRAEMLNASMVRVELAPNGSRAYALWSKQGELFFSESTGLGTWEAPQRIGTVDGQYYLLLNGETITAVWRDAPGPNRVVLNARVYRTGFPWGDVRQMEVSESAQFSSPVIDTQGRAYIVRQELLNNSAGGLTLLLYQNSFTTATGWSADETLPSLPVEVYSSVSLTLAVAGQQQVYVAVGINGVVGFNDSGLYLLSPASQFGWQNLLNAPNTLVGKPVLVATETGRAMAAWVQSRGQSIGSPQFHLYTSSHGNGGFWEAPQRAGLLSDNFESDPRLLMSGTGEVTAFWVSETFTHSTLYSNHYTPGIGWGSNPDLIVSNETVVNGQTASPDAVISTTGAAYVAWKQILRSQFDTQYSVWISQSQGL